MKALLTLLPAALLALPAAAQNTCDTAIPVGLAQYYVSAVDGSEVPDPVCATGGNNATAGEWYSFTATQDTFITVTTDLPQNAGLDTRVQVYTGTCGDLTCHAGDDDSGNGYLSTVNFSVTAGTTYYIAFDNNWSSDGFTFQVEKTPPQPPVYGFTEQFVTTIGYAYCVVDMNADGLDDAVSVDANNININYQLPGGGFNDVNYPTTTADNTPFWSLCAGDLDGNGYNDLVYAGSGLTFMQADSNGTGYTELSQPQYIFCQRSNLVDINNDGNLDAFSCHDVAPNVYYINNGDGTYTWHQGGLGDTPDGGNYGSIWVDYNNDGLLDMFIAKCRGAQSPASIDQLWRNNGDGTFTDVAAQMNLADYQQAWSAAWGDFDNDGDMDVMIGASSFVGGGHKLMRNDGDTFTNVTAGSGFDTFTGTSIEFIARDFNNDGWIDILGGGALMLNNGDMTFTNTAIPASNGPTGDLNNDGFIDVQNGNGIWMNNGNANHWITLTTTGTVSNKNGIGARVRISSAMGHQIRDVRSGDGFRYMSSLNTHFGLGADDQVDTITVRWPSGIVDQLTNVPADTVLNIVEGNYPIGTVGITGPGAATNFSVWPVPAQDLLHVRSAWALANSSATVTDLTGKTVMNGSMRGNAIDVSALPAGMYFLKVWVKGTPLVAKFAKE